jgi:hypothetical protein
MVSLKDQTEEEMAAMPPVDFDTNKKHKIIEKENLPFKKIQTDSFEAIGQRLNFKDSEMKPIDQVKDSYPEEELKVETVEESEDLKDIMFDQEPMEPEPIEDLEEFKIDEQAEGDREMKKTKPPKQDDEDINVPNIPEIDEFNDEEEEMLGKTVVEDDIDTSGFKEMEEIVNEEIEKEKVGVQPEKEDIEIELDQEPFKGLQDIPIGMDEEPRAAKVELGEPVEEEIEEIEELEEIGELVEEGDIKKTAQAPKSENVPEDIKDAEPFKLEEEVNLDINETPFQELEESKEIEPETPFQELEEGNEIEHEAPFKELEDVKEVEEIKEVKKKEIEEVEELKKTLEKEKENKENKKILITPNGMDLFEKLKDKTRLTVIKEVPVKGPDAQLLIDIKDRDSNLLESVKVKITPEIKKVTLILDVKK